jgi:hypothetical protein
MIGDAALGADRCAAHDERVLAAHEPREGADQGVDCSMVHRLNRGCPEGNEVVNDCPLHGSEAGRRHEDTSFGAMSVAASFPGVGNLQVRL